MSQVLSESAILTLIKQKLNGERIKLWLSPYSYEDGIEAEFTLELKKRYTEELGLPSDVVAKAIDSLRNSSFERYAARNQFLSKSLANLKIKIVDKNTDKERKFVFVKTRLDVSGSFLRQQVAQQCEVDSERIKLIANGRLITDDASLEDQKIAVITSIMALLLPNSKESTSADSSSTINSARDEAELLANQAVNSDDSNSMMEIADQNNRPIAIPKHERKALTLALILNEKGKSAIAHKNYAEAVLLLLEADKEFQKCNPDLLVSVDNYALLCMDIAWCYLCLGSIEDLPDAEKRVETCQQFLIKSYGPNMQRVKKVKGSTGCEEVLFVRLKLLKGIAAFFRRDWKISGKFFKEVEEDLQRYAVSDEKLSELMALGYSTSEARMALRTVHGDVGMAVNHLLNKEKEREELRKEEEEKEKLMKCGKTANGEWVNVKFYNALLSMGYPHGSSVEALKQSNNNISLAVQIIQEQPDLLNFANSNYNANTDLIEQVKSCGFSEEAAKNCLQKHGGNVHAAVVELLETGGFCAPITNNPGTSTSSNTETSQADAALIEAENAAFKRLKKDISKINYEDSYLDFTLEEETKFLNEYTILLRYSRQ